MPKTNPDPDAPAYPLANWQGDPDFAAGLTKREAFAMAAMQGLAAGGALAPLSRWRDVTSRLAVEHADALIAELNKSEGGEG